MNIILIEDDYLQANWLSEQLSEAFQEATVEIIKTEHHFLRRVESIVANPPDIFIIDVMLKWTNPAPEMPPQPPKVEEEGFYRAGFRCQEKLQKYAKTRDVPVIFYTILGEKDLEEELEKVSENVLHLQKQGNTDSLIRQIRDHVE